MKMIKMKYISLLVLAFIFAFTVKAYAYDSLVNQCFSRIDSQSYMSAKKLGLMAVESNYKSFNARLCLGEANENLGNYKVAISEFSFAVPAANNKTRKMLVYNWLGSAYHNIGNQKEAFKYDSMSLALARRANDTSLESNDLNNIGTIYLSEGRYAKSLHYYEESLPLHVTASGLAVTYGNIGVAYYGMGNCPEAIKYQTKALNLLNSDKNKNGGDYYVTAVNLINLGGDNICTKNYSRANIDITEGLTMVKKIGAKKWIATGYRYLGRLYRNEGNNKKSLFYYRKAHKMYRVIGSSGRAHDTLMMINKIKENR
ncbi:MAG: tetratricopeptide repeat protein [Candidatus Acididesulfobacter diazotrophicus]|jgi:tetratricopeptide (TPR) repeat protein|uniref:Tetratricopeptide repeat protein n=1 Tax=Candidatus Acididesulfobacter diazotrophicus TaxID=2597226 RepID=A0A519BKU6_9DELT|nr:MAG: tetratricopeptide repeat protein [Candidatus Acididesulfobacter diazotrophicus]